MTLRIRSGAATVIASGTVASFGGNTLRYELSLPERLFVLELVFHSDAGRPDPRVESVPTDDGYVFGLYNFDAQEGRGSARPVLLADLGDDALFLHFRVSHHGRTDDRTVQYTFYRVAKAAIAWTPVVPEADGG